MRKDEFPIVDKVVKDSINDVLVKIRDEIDAIRPYDYPCNMRIPERIRDMAVEIVEKYIGDDDK